MLPYMDVLLVEDDAELARQLVAELAAEGHRLHPENDGARALAAALEGTWDVIILDVALPRLNGFEIVQRLRAASLDVPVIFLSALGDVPSRVKGLLLGGDDYLTKPFSMDELKARLRVVERTRARNHAGDLALPEGWGLNPLLREVVVAGTRIPLQPREWSLLELFLRHEGEVLSKSFLLDRAWGIRCDPGTNVVDAVIYRLRQKLDRAGNPSHIQTLRGRGYVFHRNA
jgi:two-component system OmpR family response regulator